MSIKVIKKAALAFLFSMAVTPVFAQNADKGPRELVELTVNQIVELVEKHPGDQNRATRRAEILKVINERFDFEEMSKRSLGAEWQKITADQQSEFVKVFSDLLARTYINKVDELRRNMVEIKEQKLEANKALVKTIVEYKKDKFPLDYKLLNQGNWRVYDVIIENIGLVANYRNEFAGIIRKEKFPGLLERLKKKNIDADKK
jgi:phospholipid transport system substrate-binding protein